ncbi:MAG TPA: MlaD family protein [Thermoanaerobaculia bacterium]|nr:MlaD family protein [Thermoanaerobaculia bacterium]
MSSEYDEIEKDRRNAAAPEADVHVRHWSPWIWVVPALAIFFVGYLIVRYGFFGGGDITVHFAEARGLDRYSPVRFRGAKVGTVQKITIDEELNKVVVRNSMDASMNYALRKGTKFWIQEAGIEGGGVGGLLSGTSVGIAPGAGEETREFVGEESPPILSPSEAGKTFILEAHGLGGLAAGSPVQFNGMRVGRVLGVEYDDRRGLTKIHAFVSQRYAGHVRQSTRFWRAGGLNVSLGGGGLSLAGAGLGSLLTSPVSFYTPEVMAGAPVADKTAFQLYESQPAAIASADGPHLTYLTYFPAGVRGLGVGTPVQMRGVQVGRVREVRLRYLPGSRSLETPVVLEVDPRLMDFSVTDAMSRDELRAMLNDALGGLVQKGMRASLATSLVLPGASAVTLDIVARPGTARLVTENNPPIIPAAAAGSGLEGVLGSVNEIAGRIRNLPIEEIAGDLRSTARRMNALVNDPVLDTSLQRLNRSLADVEQITAKVRDNTTPIVNSVRSAAEKAEDAATSAKNAANTIEGAATTASESIEPIVTSLRNAASSAESAAGRAQQLMGTSARQNYDLGELIKELTRAAEAVRGLATYLEENPDALLKGRGKPK